MVVNRKCLNLSVVKMISLVIVFISICSIAAHACDTNFCSSIACTSSCQDTCDGSYWLYGTKACSSSCYFSGSNHCKYEKRICADANSTDGGPILGCGVKTCNAECDSFGTECKNKCVDQTWYHAGSCSLTACSCSYTTQNCDLQDGCYAYGTGCENRDYFCQAIGCNYTFSNRNTDYNDNYVNYCSADTIRTHMPSHDFYCGGTCLDHVGWTGDSQVQNCNDLDGWYNTTNTQWISTGQCTEKEQTQQEYRDYTCSGNPSVSCTYTVTDSKPLDTGNTRNKENGTSCDDGQYCTVNDVCTVGQCDGSQRDCSGNNLDEIATCNGVAFDYAAAFTSTCDGNANSCTSGDSTITHTCNKATCGAECEQDSDCTPTLSGDSCHYGTSSCNTDPTLCSCNYADSQYCPVPGTVTDGTCYYGTQSCSVDGCGLSSATMVSSNMFCDPIQGPVPTLNDTNPCNSNEECISNNCASDYTGSGKWCAPSGDCSHDGVTYSNGATTCDDSTKETCDNDVWNGNACPNGCSNGDCNPPSSSGGGSGGGSVGGGTLYVFSGAIKIVAVCGNGVCDYNETCSNCPKDCLKDGQVCCKDIPYLGSCCLDVDCEKGYECSLSKECKLIHTATEIEICKEDWICDNWADCKNDVQTRVCLDKNNCGTIKDRPELVQKCGGLVPGTLTGLFLFLTSPLGYGTIIAFIMLLLFFWRRLKHISVQPQ